MALTKLYISAFKQPDFSQPNGFLSVQINPSEIKESRTINYEPSKVSGGVYSSSNFTKFGAHTITFSLDLDGTGVIPNDGFMRSKLLGNNRTNVFLEVKALENVIFEFKGDTHRPNYLIIKWHTFIFHCQATKFDISYTLFAPNGMALRAKVDLSFEQFTDRETAEKKKNTNSPDLSHLKTVRQGDQLILFCQEIYNTPNYYLQVARTNNLVNFRNLKPGRQLLFPPIQK